MDSFTARRRGFFYGTVYAIDSTGQLTTFHSFTGKQNGAKNPHGKLLQDAEGNFYGTSTRGGGTARGTVFKLTPEGVETILHVFNQTDGQNPTAGLTIGADGAFYGVTPTGGLQFGKGTIFRITADGQFTMLHAFTGGDGIRALRRATPRQRREPVWDNVVGWWRWSWHNFQNHTGWNPHCGA